MSRVDAARRTARRGGAALSGSEAHPDHHQRADEHQPDGNSRPDGPPAMPFLQRAAPARADRRLVEAAFDGVAGLDAVSERVFVGGAHRAIGPQLSSLCQS